jgi:hypothetical protein
MERSLRRARLHGACTVAAHAVLRRASPREKRVVALRGYHLEKLLKDTTGTSPALRQLLDGGSPISPSIARHPLRLVALATTQQEIAEAGTTSSGTAARARGDGGQERRQRRRQVRGPRHFDPRGCGLRSER